LNKEYEFLPIKNGFLDGEKLRLKREIEWQKATNCSNWGKNQCKIKRERAKNGAKSVLFSI